MVGFHKGIGRHESHAPTVANPPAVCLRFATYNIDGAVIDLPERVIGGGQIGYDWQVNRWVFGAIADFQGADIRASVQNTVTPAAFPITTTQGLSEKLNLLGTLRARVGWASNDWLFYGSGGFAYGNVRSTLNLDDPADALSFAGSKSETRAGWAAGGSIGYAIMPNWIIGVDYLHYDLGRANVTAFGAVIDPASGFVFSAGSLTASQSVAGDIVRGVINYKL